MTKVFPGLKAAVLLLVSLFACAAPVRAQTNLDFTVFVSTTNAVLTGTPVTYAIVLTNQNLLTQVVVTNFFSQDVPILDATVSSNLIPRTTFLTSSSSVAFLLSQLFPGEPAELTITVAPQTEGLFTNMIVAGAFELGTNLVGAEVVIQVTNAPKPSADLFVTLDTPRQPVIVNDFTAYDVTVWNFGPATATNVFLTNTLPSQVTTINVGLLTNGAMRTFSVAVQPRIIGTFSYSASVGDNSTIDPVPADNVASNSFEVMNYGTNLLQVTLNGEQTLNRNLAVMEQPVLLTNISGVDVPSARVLVGGLTNILFNAWGTNGLGTNQRPFVVHGTTLAAGEGLEMVLLFAPNRSPFPIGDTNLQAFEVPAANLAPPSSLGPAIDVAESDYISISENRFLVRIHALTNRTYTVLYSTNVDFADAKVAMPPVLSQANWLRFIDYGPPATIRHPATDEKRFYRFHLNP